MKGRQVYRRKAQRRGANRVRKELLTPYLLWHRASAKKRKPGELPPAFFVSNGGENHNILCRTKNQARNFLFFFWKLPLSGKESCDIMTYNDEIARGMQ